MKKLLRDFQNLHRAPDHWSLDTYPPHAWRLTRNVWLFMIGFCAVLGIALKLNPAKAFGENQPFTYYTVILLGICGVVCGQCARLTDPNARAAWVLMAIGFFFLAADDLFKIHEELDVLINQALRLDPKAKLPDLLDSAIVVTYGLAGAVVLYLQRRPLFKLQGFTEGLAKAGVAFSAMTILDVIGDLLDSQHWEAALQIVEESCKALAISLLFWTFVTARFQLRRVAQASRL